jgi:methyl-accepting chemotaxis protein
MKKAVLVMALVIVAASFASGAWAQGACSKEEVMKQVDQAVAVLEKEGEAGLPKVGEMRFCGDNYLFVNDLNAKTLMHAQPHLIGKVLIGLKDDTGKMFFSDFTSTVKIGEATKDGKTYFGGSGWVSYRWPKPGEKAFSPKVTFVKGCLMGGENVYVGGGYYE